MKKNRIRICGRNTSTLPTPPRMPSTSKLRSRPSAICAWIHWPTPSTPPLIRSIGVLAQLNTAWNTKNISIASRIGPITGCNTIWSIFSVRLPVSPTSLVQTDRMRRTSRWVSCTGTKSIAASERATAGSVCGSASSALTSAVSPPLRTATVSTTGMPSSCASLSVSITMLRRLATSTMFSASTIGRPSRLISSTSRRFSRKLVASTTHTMLSGAASPARSPATTSRVIASSGVVADRL